MCVLQIFNKTKVTDSDFSNGSEGSTEVSLQQSTAALSVCVCLAAVCFVFPSAAWQTWSLLAEFSLPTSQSLQACCY